MRRTIRSAFQFIVLAGLTVLVTNLVFHYVYHPRARERKADVDFPKGAMPVAPEEKAFEMGDLQKYGEKDEIDWHDYKQIALDLQRTGLGEQGKPGFLSPSDEKQKKALYDVMGFNGLLSDRIALDRSLPDIRHKGCKKKKYLAKLASVSVVVPFYNEHWSTLLRTVTSVIKMSPSHLIKEIILVDDNSPEERLKAPLDSYVAQNLPKVKVIRLPERNGLITARLVGAKQATGEVLIFLDSHTEANVNWLPPLLDPIARNYRTCVCPFIDVISHDTFEYHSQDEGARGAFDWEFYYKRLPLLEEDLKHPTEPFRSPVMAGGLFAISSKFFWELGGYDEGLQIWGGEQYELSFKIWQCGGQLLDAPCSRVGHIYRGPAPHAPQAVNKGDFIGKNYVRVAEVWMDEYKEYLYKRKPHYRSIDPGDLTKQRAIREKLQCKPFKWFMENIAFDLVKKYPPIEPPDFAEGEIRSLAAPHLCVDTDNKKKNQNFGLKKCLKDNPGSSGEQSFILTWHKDIRIKNRKKMCWDVTNWHDKAAVNIYDCHEMGGNQLWQYNREKHWLVHGGNPRCLDCDPQANEIFVTKCDDSSSTQKWKFEKVHPEAFS